LFLLFFILFLWGFYANSLLLYTQELKGAPPAEELQVVAFPIIQEKLYLENNCLVPEKFVEILAKHFDAQSKPLLSNNLHQLLTSIG